MPIMFQADIIMTLIAVKIKVKDILPLKSVFIFLEFFLAPVYRHAYFLCSCNFSGDTFFCLIYSLIGIF